MQSINTKGLLVDGDFLINFKEFNLTAEEAIFFMQLSYLTDNGGKVFSIKSISSSLNLPERQIFTLLDALLRRKAIRMDNNSKITFTLLNKKDDYYTLKQLFQFVESVVGRILTSKEMDIVTSWLERKFTKAEMNDAFNLSKNISYVNGILNNRGSVEIQKTKESDNILSYDWLNK